MSKTRVTVTLNKEQYDRLKVLAEAKAISLSEVIRECCTAQIESDAEEHQANPLLEIESKYTNSLEDRVELLKDQLEKKDQLIESLTNGEIVLKEKENSSIGFFQKVRNLLLPSG